MKKLYNLEKLIFFNNISLSEKSKILVLALHPDDFDATGLMLKQLFQQGQSIYLAVMSSGASGVEDSFCSPSTDTNFDTKY